MKGLLPDTLNYNFISIFDNRILCRAKWLYFMMPRWYCPHFKIKIEKKEKENIIKIYQYIIIISIYYYPALGSLHRAPRKYGVE